MKKYLKFMLLGTLVSGMTLSTAISCNQANDNDTKSDSKNNETKVTIQANTNTNVDLTPYTFKWRDDFKRGVTYSMEYLTLASQLLSQNSPLKHRGYMQVIQASEGNTFKYQWRETISQEDFNNFKSALIRVYKVLNAPKYGVWNQLTDQRIDFPTMGRQTGMVGLEEGYELANKYRNEIPDAIFLGSEQKELIEKVIKNEVKSLTREQLTLANQYLLENLKSNFSVNYTIRDGKVRDKNIKFWENGRTE